MVVIAAFIERRYLALFGFEDPFQGFASGFHATYIMFGAAESLAGNHGVAAFFSILGQCCVGSHELAERIVCLVVGLLAEFYGTLHDSYLVFVLHHLLGGYLQDDIGLTYFQVGQFVHRLADEGIDESGVVGIQCGAFPSRCADPVGRAFLSVNLGDIGKVGASLQGRVDTVGQSCGFGFRVGIDLNLTEFNRVGSSGLGDNLEGIVGVFCLVVVRTIDFTDGNGIQTGCYIRRQYGLIDRNVGIDDGGTRRTDKCTEIAGNVCQLVAVFSDFLKYFLAVGFGRSDPEVDVLDVAGFYRLLERLFTFLVELLDVGIADGHGRVADRGVGDACQQDVRLLGSAVECIFGSDGVRDEGFGDQILVFLGQCGLLQGLFDEVPEVAHFLIVFNKLCAHVGTAEIGIGHQELLQHVLVEGAGLRVAERCLRQQRMCAFLDDVLDFRVRHGQSQFFGFGCNEFVVDIRLPYLVLDLRQLFFGEGTEAVRQFDDFAHFVHQLLVVLC